VVDKKKRKFNWHELRVGIFVIGSFAILIFMIFRVSGGRGFFTPKVMAVTYLPTISGLKPGAPVWLNGIEIGNVEEIALERQLPDTKANQETRQKIRETEANIQRYERIIQATEHKVDELRLSLAHVGAKEVPARSQALREEEDRLTAFRRTLKEFREELKSDRNNLQSIRLILKIEKEYAGWIKKDSEVTIGSIGLLGDKYVDISIGRRPEEPEKTAEGYLVIEAINEATLRQLMVGANDLMANFGDISERVKSIMSKLDAGEGTFGQLINNDSLHKSLVSTVTSLDRTVQSAGVVMDDIHTSEGTLGQLIHDKKLYAEYQSVGAELRSFLKKLNESDGTVNKLISDPSLFDHLRQVTGRREAILAKIEGGEGTLGKLSTDPALFQEARDSMAKIHSIMAQIDQGQGTMGQLLKDRQLYDNLSGALAELTKLVYDIRKNPKQYLRIQFKLF